MEYSGAKISMRLPSTLCFMTWALPVRLLQSLVIKLLKLKKKVLLKHTLSFQFLELGKDIYLLHQVWYSNVHISFAQVYKNLFNLRYDRTLGGLEMQLRLRDYLAKKFNALAMTPNDVFKNPRAMAKLFKEAGRLKTVLSANVDHYAQVKHCSFWLVRYEWLVTLIILNKHVQIT